MKNKIIDIIKYLTLSYIYFIKNMDLLEKIVFYIVLIVFTPCVIIFLAIIIYFIYLSTLWTYGGILFTPILILSFLLNINKIEKWASNEKVEK